MSKVPVFSSSSEKTSFPGPIWILTLPSLFYVCFPHHYAESQHLYHRVFPPTYVSFGLIYIVTNRINDCKVFTTKLIQKIRIVDATVLLIGRYYEWYTRAIPFGKLGFPQNTRSWNPIEFYEWYSRGVQLLYTGLSYIKYTNRSRTQNTHNYRFTCYYCNYC